MTEIVLISSLDSLSVQQLTATYAKPWCAHGVSIAHGASSFSKRPQVFRSSGADDGQSTD